MEISPEFRSGIESISMSKEAAAKIELGIKGPVVKIFPDTSSPSGLTAEIFDEGHQLNLGSNVIGRSPDCQIVVDIPTVSREHATVTVGDHEYSISDLGSTNGTYLVG
jgi:pSer/pThr/pTyr-binding forkhead associated (FHA) protein